MARLAAHGFAFDAKVGGDDGLWVQLNARELVDLDDPVLPVGQRHRRQGLGTALLRFGMLLARDAGADRMLVTCLGAPAYAAARELYYSVGFTELTRDVPHIKPAG